MARLTAQARAHRSDLAALAQIAENDLRVLLRPLSAAEVAKEALRDVLPRLVAVYGDAAAALAADWYEDTRDRAEVRGRFAPVLAQLPDRGRTDALAGWGVSPLYQAEPDVPTTISKVSGGLQRIIADAARGTIQASSIADPRARGWARAGVGECEFCQMLIGRGAVYTEATADFESHDRCGCIAVPEFT